MVLTFEPNFRMQSNQKNTNQNRLFTQPQQNTNNLFTNAAPQNQQPLFSQQQQIPQQQYLFQQQQIPQQYSIPSQSPPYPIPQMFPNSNHLFGFNNQNQQIPQQPSLFGNFIQNQNVQQQQIGGEDDEIDIQQHAKEQNQQHFYDLENNLSFEIRTLYKLGKLLDSRPQYLPGVISVKTKDGQVEGNKSSRVGVDLICLIDKSGSMQGDKIHMVQQTLNVLLDFLTEKDRLQLITFESWAQKLTPLKKVNDTNKQYLKNVISSLYAGGGTTIATATEIAFASLKNRKQRNNVTSIFILSDGQDNSAENTVRQQLTTVNEVFTIHSFGFGSDHDAKMMTALCNLGKGSFYFVQNITLLDEFFADALGGLISVVGSEIAIEANCSPVPPYQDVHISKTFSAAWNSIENNRKYRIAIPQISSGSRKDFVFELGLPKFLQKIDDQHRNAQLMEAKIRIKNATNGQIIEKYAKLEITFFNQDEQIQNNEQDLDVAAQYYRIKATVTIEEARKKCDQNKNEEAQQMIENMIAAIKGNPKVAALCEGVLQDLQQAKQGASRQSYNMFGQQQMCQMVSNNYNQSGMNALFSASGAQMQSAQPQMYQNKCSYNMMQQVQQKKC